jgi:undecaprenol kinase
VRIHAVVAALVVVAGVALRLPPVWWALVVLAIGLVVAAELLNTAIEAVVDLVTLDEHPLAKRAKDVAAAGVLVAVLTALGIGLSLGVWLSMRR